MSCTILPAMIKPITGGTNETDAGVALPFSEGRREGIGFSSE
jgi:hypothetical protein